MKSHRVAANPVGLWNLRQRFESAWDYMKINFCKTVKCKTINIVLYNMHI